MAFDMSIVNTPRNGSPDANVAVVLLGFDNDVFGPVKALQLFAGIGQLPDSYVVSSNEDSMKWSVVLTTKLNAQTERVLAKIQSMPALIEFSREDAN
nr:hypothetical protein [Hyphomonas sp. Mor2]